jgi:hypothetical protein
MAGAFRRERKRALARRDSDAVGYVARGVVSASFPNGKRDIGRAASGISVV